MKVKDFNSIMGIVRESKPSRLEIINLMYTMQRALSDNSITNKELYVYFKGRQTKDKEMG